MPQDDDGDRETGPLGSEVSDPSTGDDQDSAASGAAGPSYPPEDTEPDAH